MAATLGTTNKSGIALSQGEKQTPTVSSGVNSGGVPHGGKIFSPRISVVDVVITHLTPLFSFESASMSEGWSLTGQTVRDAVTKISEWTVLFTKQKNKKSKVWSDGALTVYSNRKATLAGAESGLQLDSFYLKSAQANPSPGDCIETDGFLIEVDCERSSASAAASLPPATQAASSSESTNSGEAPRPTNSNGGRAAFAPPRAVQPPLPTAGSQPLRPALQTAAFLARPSLAAAATPCSISTIVPSARTDDQNACRAPERNGTVSRRPMPF
jgi:hypothetical protein